MVKRGSVWGLVGRDGSPRTDFEWDEVGDEPPLAGFVVMRADKWGIINSDGKPVIPLEWEALEVMPNDLVLLNRAGKRGLLTWKGKEIIPPKYADIRVEHAGEPVRTFIRLSYDVPLIRAIQVWRTLEGAEIWRN